MRPLLTPAAARQLITRQRGVPGASVSNIAISLLPARARGLAQRRTLLAGTMLAGVVLSAAFLVAPALADGGAGGGVPAASFATGGAGGTGFTGAAGGNGDTDSLFSAGGGGGAAGGGSGGSGGTVSGLTAAGGAGGTAPSPDGQAGQAGGGFGSGGGGGGGGYNGNGAGAATISNTSPLMGGNGGAGGAAGAGGGGGGGGAGGYGAIVTGSGASSNTSTVTGGTGGAGGAGSSGGAVSGNGGDGGVGIQFTGTGATLTNSGTVAGGAGGAGGIGAGGATNGNPGAGGDGIVGADLTIINSGTIIGGLSGDSVTRANAITFTGGTNMLELQAGSSITGNVVAFSTADTLRLGGTSNASFDVSQIGLQYLGFGIFQKTGSSTWTLTGTNAAVLPWTINAGTLDVNGSIASSPLTTVNAGGTLGGTGTVGDTAISNGGVLAPGNGTAGSSLTVANLAFQSGALYAVVLNSTNSSFVNVIGNAALDGTVVASFLPASTVLPQYQIMNVGSHSGNFSGVSTPGGLVGTISTTPTAVFLNFTLDWASKFNLNINQTKVANTLVDYFNTNGTIPAAFASLSPAGLTQVSGELGIGSQQATFNAMNQFMGVMTDPFVAGRGDPVSAGRGPSAYAEEGMAYAAKNAGRSKSERNAYAAIYAKAPVAPSFEQRWRVWAAGFGGSQATDGNAAAGSNDTTSSIYGTAVGADYRFSPHTLAGFALAGGGTNFSVNGLGSGRSDLFQAGAYLRHFSGPAYVSAALAYGWQDVTTNRIVTIAGVDQLRAQFNANAWSGRLEGGYRLVAPWAGGLGITPYAAAQFTAFELPTYAEQAISGASTFVLSYAGKSVTDTRSELGIRTDKSFALPNGVLTLRGRFAWAHDFEPDRSIAATFQALPGASFVVNGAAQAADSALTTASVEMKWINGWSAAAAFEGEFSKVTASYAGKCAISGDPLSLHLEHDASCERPPCANRFIA